MSCCLYRFVLEERPSVCALASALDDSESSTTLARTRILGRSSSTTRYKQHDMLPHRYDFSIWDAACGLTSLDFFLPENLDFQFSLSFLPGWPLLYCIHLSASLQISLCHLSSLSEISAFFQLPLAGYLNWFQKVLEIARHLTAIDFSILSALRHDHGRGYK